MEQKELQFLRLLYYGVHHITDKKDEIQAYDLQGILPIARAAGLASFIAWVLQQNQIEHAGFHTARNLVIAHCLQMQAEEREVTEFMNREGIPYIPLKGMSLRNLYPAFATREMGDLDILICEKDRSKMKKYLRSQAYDMEKEENADYHDAYCRGLVTLELHYALFRKGPTKAWKDFSRKVCQTLERGAHGSGSLSAEDEYVYLIAHGYKHYAVRGIGVRFLLDIYYFRKAYATYLKAPDIEKHLQSMGILEFEKNAVQLSEAILGKEAAPENLDVSLQAEIMRYLRAGLNGQEWSDGQILPSTSLVYGKGWSYIFRSALLELQHNDGWLAFNAPFAWRHRWAVPISLFYQSVRKVLQDPKAMISRYGSIHK